MTLDRRKNWKLMDEKKNWQLMDEQKIDNWRTNKKLTHLKTRKIITLKKINNLPWLPLVTPSDETCSSDSERGRLSARGCCCLPTGISACTICLEDVRIFTISPGRERYFCCYYCCFIAEKKTTQNEHNSWQGRTTVANLWSTFKLLLMAPNDCKSIARPKPFSVCSKI